MRGLELNKLARQSSAWRSRPPPILSSNAMAAGIPGTSYTGMPYAAAHRAGEAAAPERKLEVVNGVWRRFKAAELLGWKPAGECGAGQGAAEALHRRDRLRPHHWPAL